MRPAQSVQAIWSEIIDKRRFSQYKLYREGGVLFLIPRCDNVCFEVEGRFLCGCLLGGGWDLRKGRRERRENTRRGWGGVKTRGRKGGAKGRVPEA
eukprot:3290121-Rhodomonas_salina.2